ncbi:MAG: hypothetical protein L0Y50_11065 [Beijerinckiaceae bacterium]|nr:hypothetical protein [Beijerinckiaceae bacterium]
MMVDSASRRMAAPAGKLPQTDELDTKIDEAGLDALEYNNRGGRYRLRLTKDDIKTKTDILKELSQLAYERRTSA